MTFDEYDLAIARELMKYTFAERHLAKALGEARKRENQACEIDVLGDSCSTTSSCLHSSCAVARKFAKIIAARRTP